jgi:hypothetical protein
MPTTVDLEVAMTSLTVMRGVYSSGAERWQAGGGSGMRHRLQRGACTKVDGSGPDRGLQFGARQTSRGTSVLAGRSPEAWRRRERIEYTDPAAPPPRDRSRRAPRARDPHRVGDTRPQGRDVHWGCGRWVVRIASVEHAAPGGRTSLFIEVLTGGTQGVNAT